MSAVCSSSRSLPSSSFFFIFKRKKEGHAGHNIPQLSDGLFLFMFETVALYSNVCLSFGKANKKRTKHNKIEKRPTFIYQIDDLAYYAFCFSLTFFLFFFYLLMSVCLLFGRSPAMTKRIPFRVSARIRGKETENSTAKKKWRITRSRCLCDVLCRFSSASALHPAGLQERER